MNMTEEIGIRRVAVFHHDPETLQTIIRALEQLGHEISFSGDDGRHLVNTVRSNPEVDMIVTGNQLSSIDGVSALLEIADQRDVPAIVVTRQRSLEMVERALQDHVMAYLIEPITAEEIKPTVYLVVKRFEQFVELKQEVEDLQELLETRRNIERAKGVLMRRHDINENQAYSRLRKAAMDGRVKIIAVAMDILKEDSLATNQESG